MTNTVENNPQPVAKCYRPWVGVFLSFFIAGAGQFCSGSKVSGIKWFIGILLLSLVALSILALPEIPGLWPGAIAFIFLFVLWIWMLCNAYRPVRKIAFWGWMLLVILFFVARYTESAIVWLFFKPQYVPTNSMAPTIQGETTKGRGGD